MTAADANGLEYAPATRLWRQDGLATLLAAAATIALGCGAFIAGRCISMPADRAALMSLFTLTVWVAVAAAPLAAGASTRLGAVCRGGAIADAGIVVLIVLALAGGAQVSWGAAVKIYLLWAALAVTLCLIVSASGSRRIAAVVATAAAVAAISSRFWAAGLLDALAPNADALYRTTRLLGALDVAGGVADAASSAKPFVWNEQPVMYQLTRQGQDYPAAAVGWWVPALTWWIAAGLIAAAVGVRTAAGRFFRGT